MSALAHRIVLDNTVYLQDLNSNVYALDRASGKIKWAHKFNKPSEGPNGIAFGYGRIYGATATKLGERRRVPRGSTRATEPPDGKWRTRGL